MRHNQSEGVFSAELLSITVKLKLIGNGGLKNIHVVRPSSSNLSDLVSAVQAICKHVKMKHTL